MILFFLDFNWALEKPTILNWKYGKIHPHILVPALLTSSPLLGEPKLLSLSQISHQLVGFISLFNYVILHGILYWLPTYSALHRYYLFHDYHPLPLEMTLLCYWASSLVWSPLQEIQTHVSLLWCLCYRYLKNKSNDLEVAEQKMCHTVIHHCQTLKSEPFFKSRDQLPSPLISLLSSESVTETLNLILPSSVY